MGIQDGEFELDLTNFEERQKQRYAQAGVDLDADAPDDEVEVQRSPWEDERSFDELYSAETIWKARSLILDHRVEKTHEKRYIVQGSQPYVVNLLEGDQDVPWAVCSCPNGEKRGGRPSCYHSAAVLATVLNIDLTPRERPKKLSSRS
jgi:hypothetical protein